MMKQELDIESSTKDVILSGTLSGSNRENLMILFSGSGAQDRHQTVAGKKTFKSLSEGLMKYDFDSFSWDDRGVGKSSGNYYQSDSGEIINDGVRIFHYFKTNYNYKRIILLGHSQGTLIATKVALECPADALILCAGIIRDGKTALLDQHKKICEADNLESEEIDISLMEKEALFDLLIDFEQNKKQTKSAFVLKDKLWDFFLNGADKNALSNEDSQQIKEIIDDLTEWEWRYILTENSLNNIQKLDIPILALFGEKDVQVNSEKEVSILKKLALNNVSIKILENHNHLFQYSKNFSIGQYEMLGEPFTEVTQKTIAHWLKSVVL